MTRQFKGEIKNKMAASNCDVDQVDNILRLFEGGKKLDKICGF